MKTHVILTFITIFITLNCNGQFNIRVKDNVGDTIQDYQILALSKISNSAFDIKNEQFLKLISCATDTLFDINLLALNRTFVFKSVYKKYLLNSEAFVFELSNVASPECNEILLNEKSIISIGSRNQLNCEMSNKFILIQKE